MPDPIAHELAATIREAAQSITTITPHTLGETMAAIKLILSTAPVLADRVSTAYDDGYRDGYWDGYREGDWLV